MFEVLIGVAENASINWPLAIIAVIAIATGILTIATGLGLEGRTRLSLRLLGVVFFACFITASATFKQFVRGEEGNGTHWTARLFNNFIGTLGLVGCLVIMGGIFSLCRRIVSRSTTRQEASDNER